MPYSESEKGYLAFIGESDNITCIRYQDDDPKTARFQATEAQKELGVALKLLPDREPQIRRYLADLDKFLGKLK